MAVFPISERSLAESSVYQIVRFDLLIRTEVLRPTIGDPAETYDYLRRCCQVVSAQLIADSAIFSKTQWIWYLRRLPDEVFRTLDQFTPGQFYERNIAEAISGLGGTSTAASLPVEASYPVDDTVSAAVLQLVAGTNYLAYVLELISAASRGVPIGFGDAGELPYIQPNPSYIEASVLYTKRKRQSGGRFLSRAGTELGVPTRVEQAPTSIVVVSRTEARVLAFEEENATGETRSRQLVHSYTILYMDISRLSTFIRELSPFRFNWPTLDFCYLALTSKLCFHFIDWGSAGASLVQFGYVSIDLDHLLELFAQGWASSVAELRSVIPAAKIPNDPESLCLFLQELRPSVLPMRPGPVLRVDGNLALLDITALTFLLEATSDFSTAQGGIANVRARNFEGIVQDVIDASPWRPAIQWHSFRGRTIRRKGQDLTDIDALGVRGTQLLLVSAKSYVFTTDHDAFSYRATRNATRAVLDACADAQRIASDLRANPVGSNYDFTEFSSIEVVVCLPYLVYVPIGPATETLANGLPAAISLAELKQFLEASWRGRRPAAGR